MKRRSFLQLLGIGSATAAFPALANFKLKPELKQPIGMDDYIAEPKLSTKKGGVYFFDSDVHLKDIIELNATGDSEKKMLVFGKAGKEDIRKTVMVSHVAGLAARDDKARSSEMAYQIARRCKEAYRDYLYMDYGTDFMKHEKWEPQLAVFLQDLERIEKQSLS